MFSVAGKRNVSPIAGFRGVELRAVGRPCYRRVPHTTGSSAVVDDIKNGDIRLAIIDTNIRRASVSHDLAGSKVACLAWIPKALIRSQKPSRTLLEGVGWNRTRREEGGEVPAR